MPAPKPHNYTGGQHFTVLRSGDGHLANVTGPDARNPYDPAVDSMSGPSHNYHPDDEATDSVAPEIY